MKNYRIKFKEKDSNTIYNFTGSLEGFRSIYPDAIIVSKTNAPVWDNDLKKYI